MVTKPSETMAIKSNNTQAEAQIDLYIGIDVHQKSWHVSICSQTLILQSFSQPPTVEALMTYLRKNYKGCNYHSVYEAGFCGFQIHRQLQAVGVNNIVVNPADVPTTNKEKRQKRDQADSLKLAKALRSHNLKGVYIPSLEEQEDRSLIRVRKQLVRDVARYKSRIKSHLYYKGIEIPEEFLRSAGYWKKSFKVWIAKQELPTQAGSRALREQLEVLFKLEEELKSVNQKIAELALSESFKQRIELITSIPGIGVLSGMIILTEIGRIDRFQRIDQLNSFAGFIPNVYASGDKEYVGQLTNRGNHYLLSTVIECSWWSVKKDPALAMAYEKLCKRMKPSKAIIRIARKLLARLRYVLMNKQAYQLGMN